MDILYIIVPAYNESKNINRFIDEWYPVIHKHNSSGLSRLVIIDDGSKDNTYEIISEMAKNKPLLVAIRKNNSGHGATVIYGYQYALSQNADFIFQTDSDCQTSSSEFEIFWKKRKQRDAVFGYRKKRGDGISRAFVEKVLCRILKYYFKVSIPDANAPFRLMKKEYLEKYLSDLPKEYHLPNVMLTTFGVYYKKNIEFVEISFQNRKEGKNSINMKRIIQEGWRALKDFKEIRNNMEEKKVTL